MSKLLGVYTFNVKLPKTSPLNYSALSPEQFDAEIEKGRGVSI